jgi:hypothetical protein
MDGDMQITDSEILLHLKSFRYYEIDFSYAYTRFVSDTYSFKFRQFILSDGLDLYIGGFNL